MAAAPLQHDLELVRRAHDRAGPRRDRTSGQVGPIMQAEHAVAREAFEQSFVHHLPRAAMPLFGGLEEEVDRAVKIAGPAQLLRGTQQHGDMAVMAAAVKSARRRAGIRQVGLLLDRQCVHVRTQPDAAPRRPVAQHADHPGPPDPLMHLQPQRPQLLGDPPGGAVLAKPQFRMRMNVAPKGDQRFDQVGYVGHGSTLNYSSNRSSPCRGGGRA